MTSLSGFWARRALEQFHPGHARHHHVDHGHVELPTVGHCQSLFAVTGVLDVVSAAGKTLDNRGAKLAVVVDDQQVERLGFWHKRPLHLQGHKGHIATSLGCSLSNTGARSPKVCGACKLRESSERTTEPGPFSTFTELRVCEL